MLLQRKREAYNPLRNLFLKNTTMASKKFTTFVWISSNYNAVIFSDKKSENLIVINIDSY